MSPDLANGLVQLACAAVVGANLAILLRERAVQGIRWFHPAFFTAVAVWQCWYFGSTGQWWSMLGSTLVATLNSTYAAFLHLYRRRPGRTQSSQEDPPRHVNCRCVMDPQVRGRMLDD